MADHGLQSDEQRPLLPQPRDGTPPEVPRDGARVTTSQRVVVIIICLAAMFSFEIGAGLVDISSSQLLEGIICCEHHDDVPYPPTDPRCKDTDVQADLAMLVGWQATCIFIPGLLTSLPYGVAADKYGRKPILMLSLFGLTAVTAFNILIFRYPEVFPLRLILLVALCTAVGGGPSVLNAMVCAICNDVSTELQKSATFFLLAAANMGGELLGSPMAYLAMQRGAWFTAFLGLALMCLSMVCALALPETHPRMADRPRPQQPDEPCAAPPSTKGLLSLSAMRKGLGGFKTELAKSFRVVFLDDKRIGILLSGFVASSLGRFAMSLLVQYAAKRYGWSWSQAGLLVSVNALGCLVPIVIIVPLASRALTKLSIPALVKDLWIARISAVCLVIGTFGVGLAPTAALMVIGLVVSAFGFGYGPAMRSLLTATVGSDQVAMLYGMMGLLQNTGLIIAGPLIAVEFRVGLEWGGFWVGLPFLAAGCLCSVAAVIIFVVDVVDVCKRTSAS